MTTFYNLVLIVFTPKIIYKPIMMNIRFLIRIIDPTWYLEIDFTTVLNRSNILPIICFFINIAHT